MVQAENTVFVPDVEIKEPKDSYEFNIDLPGVPEQDLEVSGRQSRADREGRREGGVVAGVALAEEEVESDARQ
ncbi:hypothetical protein WME90_36900 [Sorangium sp. So ce375]|uniref:hypothetical protein n=1 Tax=Sorangium sp. So ce375 TaxID=3133306 RepID=UPI003F5C34D6